MIHREAALALGLAVLLPQCGSADETTVSDPVTGLSMVTFNAALGVGLAPYLEERLAVIEQDLPSLGADVICLQELWQPETIDRLTASLGVEFPYSHQSVRPVGGAGGATCTEAEATLLSTCLADNCGGVDDAGLALCAIDRCAAAFTQVATPCQQCIAANQTASDVANLVNICGPAGGGAVAFENQTGLLLLSRLPLTQLDYLALPSALGDRGIVSARLQTDFAGSVDLFCTHLAASLGEVPYEGTYGSFAGERLAQIELFVEHVSSKAGEGAVALLGDMNCGPETELAGAASPDAFGLFEAAGFDAPYPEADGRCTFCSNNPLNRFDDGVDGGAAGVILDHVLIAGFPEGSLRTGARVLDERIGLTSGGAAVDTSRSDHYGVQVTVSRAAASRAEVSAP